MASANDRYASPRSSFDAVRSPANGHQQDLRASFSHVQGSAAQHRQSFSDRGYPPSPRNQRHPSISSIAVQELIDNPPARQPDARFAGRDWTTVKVGELTSPQDLKFVETDTLVEAATNVSSCSIYHSKHPTNNHSFSSTHKHQCY